MDKIVTEFLEKLNRNNNRDWFNENRTLYENARKEFEGFVDSLIPQLQKIDPQIGTISAKQAIFRIYRDIRFSKDKTPYKTWFGAFFAPGGRKSEKAGYYLHIAADDSLIGGGCHSPTGESLKKIRSEIYYNAAEFKKIINDSNLTGSFKILTGEKLKRPPAGFPKDFEDIDLLKNKSFTVFSAIDKRKILSAGFDSYVLEMFAKMRYFNRFLNRAVEG